MQPQHDPKLDPVCQASSLHFEQVLPEAIVTGGSGARDAHAGGGSRPRGAPLDALLDVDRLLDWWASVGAVLHRVRRAGYLVLHGQATIAAQVNVSSDSFTGGAEVGW